MHALILPIAHKPCSPLLSESEAAELASYVDAMRRCFEVRPLPPPAFCRQIAGRSLGAG